MCNCGQIVGTGWARGRVAGTSRDRDTPKQTRRSFIERSPAESMCTPRLPGFSRLRCRRLANETYMMAEIEANTDPDVAADGFALADKLLEAADELDRWARKRSP